MNTEPSEREEAPERIFVFKRPDGGNSWHTERLESSDIEYVRASVAAASPTTPSDAAMRAAEEIIEYGESVKWGQGRQPMYAMEIAAIITRHLAAENEY